MPGISTDMISLNISVLLFIAQSMVTVGEVLWLKVLRPNNSPSVIWIIYFDCVKEMDGSPIKLITDLEKENVLVAAMQTFFRQDIDGHQYIPSPGNQRIESWCSFFTKTRRNW